MTFRSDDDDTDDGINADTLYPAIAEAIQGVLAEHGGGMIEAFLGMVEYVGADGGHRFATMADPEQLAIRTMGMAQHMHAWELEIQRLNFHQELVDRGDQYDE